MDFFWFVVENAGTAAVVAFVLFNVAAWLARRYQKKREQEQYGHYPPAVQGGRLSYEEYQKRRGG